MWCYKMPKRNFKKKILLYLNSLVVKDQGPKLLNEFRKGLNHKGKAEQTQMVIMYIYSEQRLRR